jgi:hypothetical protein
VLKVHYVGVDLVQETVKGGLHIPIIERVPEKRRRPSLSGIEFSADAPGAESLPLLSLLTEDTTVAVVPIEDEDLVMP